MSAFHNPPSVLEALPQELLDAICFALIVAHDPDADLFQIVIPLLQTSRHLYKSLDPRFPASHALWRRVFRGCFDHSAVVRRAFNPNSEDYTDQLVLYNNTLACIRAGNVSSLLAADALCTAYIMLGEDDGKNRARLEAAGLYTFAKNWITTNLYLGSGTQDGWPRASSEATCAMWVMWELETRDRLLAESAVEREHFVRLILPFVFVPYRYTSAEAPPSHFTIPLPAAALSANNSSLTPSIPTAHGLYPVTRPYPPQSQVHFASRPSINYASICNAAKLLYVARRELFPFPSAPHFYPTRAAADAAGIRDVGPTVEDMNEVNAGCAVRLVGASSQSAPRSRRRDCDWYRSRQCKDHLGQDDGRRRIPGATYEPGTLDGLWQGRILYPNTFLLENLLNDPNFPTGGVTEQSLFVITKPFFVRFQEHHAFYPDEAIPSYIDGPSNTPTSTSLPPPNENMKHGWFPSPPTFPPTADIHSPFFHLPPQQINGPTTTFRVEPERGCIRVGLRVGNYTLGGREWVYKTFQRKSPAQEQQQQHRGWHTQHQREEEKVHGVGLGDDGCSRCRARDRWEEEREAQAEAAAAAAQDDAMMPLTEQDEAQFSSVGLGFDQPQQEDDDDYEDDAMDAESDLATQDDDAQSDGDEGVVDTSSGNRLYPRIRPTYDLDEDGDEEDDFGLNYPDADGDEDMEPVEGRPARLLRSRPSPRLRPRSKRTPTCRGIRDIIITGTTDYKHARAWGDYVYFGRVRQWDGLIGILRRSRAGLGDIFMYGYVVGGGGEEELMASFAGVGGQDTEAAPAAGPGQQEEEKVTGSPGCFVGNWRTLSDNPNHPPYECAFVMSRRA
ncbi:hypothetical protein BDN72DRAFT_959081 [Pluteus cervinus]|uniref:Uncharacterized protein n=1 Tax=Pluteus cervinus TaxID=181527 RepID=A0ACD3AWH6_9AGAR|nr:hypothetical protein BDN72DRAFT_959081 [Pluteus cervinus]